MSHIYNNSSEEVAMRYQRPTIADEDGRLDAAERQELEPLLRELLQATGDLIASLRSR